MYVYMHAVSSRIQQTLQEMAESGRGAKRVRTEAGVVLGKSAKPAVSVDIIYYMLICESL
jgi:hypothetical protein